MVYLEISRAIQAATLYCKQDYSEKGASYKH